MMTLTEYLDGMRQASTADELEAAIQAPHEHPFVGKVWSRICNVRIEAGERICDASPNGRFVPRFGPRRRLTVCGQTHRVANGGNSAGVRYVWSYAEDWARAILLAEGFTKRAFHSIWDSAFEYPHRSLQAVERALAGELPDPVFDELRLLHNRSDDRPARVDRQTEADCRSHRPCECGDDGWLWDWGGGWIGYAYHVAWHCDRCPKVFGEYLTDLRHRRGGSKEAIDA